MEPLNSYYGMGINDYKFAKGSLSLCWELGNYNSIAALCQQAGEKLMKAVIEKGFESDEELLRLLHSHNLRSLYNKIITKYKLTPSSKDCKWLGDFYFDARYPGENFVVVNENDAIECLKIVEMLVDDVNIILAQEEKRRNESAASLKSLKAFHSEK